MLPRLIPVLSLPALLAGCLAHEARVVTPADAPGIDGGTAIGGKQHATPPGAPPLVTDRSPLPRELVVSAWRRDGDGVIRRYEGAATTPLPWWQRFPCDLAVDFLPFDAVCTAEVTVAPRPVVARTRADLDREAAAAGYASPSGPAQVR